MRNALLYIILFEMLTTSLSSQTLDGDSRRTVRLQDGTCVILCRSSEDPRAYYYLPKDLKLSRRDGVPEISLMIYTNESKEITGGILHVLLTWGLTEVQEKELQGHITNLDSAGTLRGAADITLETGLLEFDQKNVFAKGLERSSMLDIKIPTQAIHKTAASFDLSPLMARFLADEIHAQDQSRKIVMKARYHYNIARTKGVVTTAEEINDEMGTSLSSWIKALKHYKLIKRIII